ncbi:MAG: MBL fold metallo-hydrolase [Planifilum sp.]|jgi:ribonuclease/clavin/mitogillin
MPKVQVETRVVDVVYALKGRYKRYGYPARFCLYYIDGLLIDTGPPRARQAVCDWLENKPLEQIALTHFHEDHSGNAREISRRRDVPVLMGKETAEMLADPPRLPLYRRAVWGQMDAVSGRELSDPLETAGHRFRVIPTPGHVDDHVAFIEEEKGWLFAGDLFLSNRLNYGMRGESVPKMIDSLRSVLQYPVETLFCGHSGVVADGRSALEKKLRFLEWLQEETCRLADRGLTPREISRRLLAGGKVMEWVTLGEFSSVHLIRSIMQGRG